MHQSWCKLLILNDVFLLFCIHRKLLHDAKVRNENFCMPDIYDRLKKAREHAGFNISEMADFLGMSFPGYRDNENGKRIPKSTVIEGFIRLGINANWLLTGEGEMLLKDARQPTGGITDEFALIPGYNVEVAAGAGAFPAEEQATRKLAFRHKWLRYRGLSPDNLVLVFARGDSMEPTISDNNTLMIDTTQRDLCDGRIYVIRADGHLIVKRIQKLWNKGILLLSDNKEYKEQLVEPNEASDLEVIGRVVWIGKDV